jgi:hypothetical protein
MTIMLLLAVIITRAALSQARRGGAAHIPCARPHFPLIKPHSSKLFQSNSLYPFSGQITNT